MATSSYYRVWPKFQNDRHGQKPIDQEILPENPVSIPTVRTNELTGPALQQLTRQGQVFGNKQVLRCSKELLQLEDFAEMAAAGARQEDAEFLHDR